MRCLKSINPTNLNFMTVFGDAWTFLTSLSLLLCLQNSTFLASVVTVSLKIQSPVLLHHSSLFIVSLLVSIFSPFHETVDILFTSDVEIKKFHFWSTFSSAVNVAGEGGRTRYDASKAPINLKTTTKTRQKEVQSRCLLPSSSKYETAMPVSWLPGCLA